MTFVWERLADGVFRCRLSFLDVTVGLVYGRAGAMLIDTGTTLTEARAIAGDVQDIANRKVSHIVLTRGRRRGRGIRAGPRRRRRRGVHPTPARLVAYASVTNLKLWT